MGFFDRLALGWNMGMTSLRVVARDKSLMLFPVLSGIAGLLLLGVFMLGIGPERLGAFTQGLAAAETAGGPPAQAPPWFGPVAMAIYFSVSFIAVYFNIALLGAAHLSMAGKDTTIGDGLRVANRHLGKIFVWSLISATVGLLLNMLEQNQKIGSFVRAVVGAAWAVITYFVAPVMIFEDKPPTEAIGRSIQLMKRTWGQNAGAQVGIGLTTMALMGVTIIGAMLLVFLLPFAAVVIIPLAVVASGVIALAGMAAKAVLAVSLYRFATDEPARGPFDDTELKAAFG